VLMCVWRIRKSSATDSFSLLPTGNRHDRARPRAKLWLCELVEMKSDLPAYAIDALCSLYYEFALE
jgi:hypothetical protein